MAKEQPDSLLANQEVLKTKKEKRQNQNGNTFFIPNHSHRHELIPCRFVFAQSARLLMTSCRQGE